MSHALAVGQVVTLTGTIFIRFELVQTFTIIRLMPAIGGVPQYRIRGDKNGQERIVKEHEIAPIAGR